MSSSTLNALGTLSLTCYCLLYLSQLHAEYNRQKDTYLAHRVAQAWELAQFIQCVSLGLTGEIGWDRGIEWWL